MAKKESYFESVKEKLKNNKLVGIILLLFLIYIGISEIIEATDKNISTFEKHIKQSDTTVMENNTPTVKKYSTTLDPPQKPTGKINTKCILSGKVVDIHGKGISNISIETSIGKKTISNDFGEFKIDDIDEDYYGKEIDISYRKTGYKSSNFRYRVPKENIIERLELN